MISEPLLHKMKILVVDDDRMTVTLLEQTFAKKRVLPGPGDYGFSERARHVHQL